MKKFLAVILAVVMVMSLSVSAFADTVWEYSSPVTLAIGWTTIFELGNADGAAFFEALKTEGATLQLIGTDLTEADRTEEEAWFQLCTQDAAGWTEGGNTKTEDIGETYEFTDEGYVMSVPAEAYNALIEACTVPSSDMQLVLNSGGSWTKAATKIIIRVVSASGEVAAETETEAPAADEPAAEEPAAEAPAETATEAPAETTTTAPAETSKAPSTGIALAVVPAVVALAAVAVSKKH